MRAAFLPILAAAGCLVAADYPNTVEGDYVIRDFRFQSGETLPELRLHYTTIGTPARDPQGVVRNAVLLLHGTGGSGRAFLTRPQFSGELFGAGQPLDAGRYFLILPDNIGHGKSSKPSDGLRARFPKYGYHDMVRAQHRLLTEKLGVGRLRLVLGTSMGCMHAWMWGTDYPEFVDALMPLACLPWPITGRNYLWRRMVVDMIRGDPGYQDGNYTAQPHGLRDSSGLLFFMVSSPLDLQKRGATRAAAEQLYETSMREASARPADANDRVYQMDASRDYDPSPDLERIRAAVYAVNFADDQVNPPELGILEREIRRVQRARYVVIPASEKTHGHSTHSWPVFWKPYLEQLLRESE